MLKASILVAIHLLAVQFICAAVTASANQNQIKTDSIQLQNFEAFLDSCLHETWQTDSVNFGKQTQRSKYEKNQSSANKFVTAKALVESAKRNHPLQHYKESYNEIDSTIKLLDQYKGSSIEIKLLQIGQKMATKDGNYLQAIGFLQRLEKSDFYPTFSKELADVMLDIAELYWSMDEFAHSMEYCEKVLPLLNYQNYEKGKIRALLIMYTNSHYVSTDSTSTDYLYRALSIAENLNDSAALSDVYQKLGLSYYRNSDQQNAIKYYKQARSFQRVKNSPEYIRISIFLQLCYTLVDSVEQVGQLSAFIVKESIKSNLQSYLSNAYRGRAWYFAKTGQRDSAVYYLDAAFENRQSLPEVKNASAGFYYYLYEVADLLDDDKRALKFLRLAHEQYVSARRKSNAEELSNIRASFDYELQQERIEHLVTENKLKKAVNSKQRIVILIITLLILLGIVFLIFARRKYAQLRGSYRELVRKNIELDKLSKRLSRTESKLQHGRNGNGIKDEEKIYAKLKQLFEAQKIYKQPDISLGKLARLLHTNTSYLSSIINSRFEESFKTLINKYRINEARTLLGSAEYSNYSVEGVAEEVGYNSRSAFYQAFKQITGLTPTQYIENSTVDANDENQEEDDITASKTP